MVPRAELSWPSWLAWLACLLLGVSACSSADGPKPEATYRIPQVDQGFVPQGLEIDGDRAFVGGYDGTKPVGRRWCAIAVLDLPSGKVRRFIAWFGTGDTRDKRTSCRHGGGLELTEDGLWVSGYDRLWLLDPERLTVRRVWWLGQGIRGSTLVLTRERIGIGGFDAHRPSTLWWFDLHALLSSGQPALPPPVATTPVPAGLQGVTLRAGRLWSVTSTTKCGSLRIGNGEPLEFVPGAEDIELRGRRLWVVSEAGTLNYRGSEGPLPLLRLDLQAVRTAARSHCPV